MTLLDATEATDSRVVLNPEATSESGQKKGRVPLTMPSAQEYYWRFPWQRDERETIASLEEGAAVEFDSDDPEDAARWLREPDEDE